MSNAKQTSNTKENFIISVFSLMPQETLSPVQVQKLFFLLEKRLQLSYFNFKPHHYGPYDKGLTDTLTMLYMGGKIQIKNIDGIVHYQINDKYIPDTANLLNKEQAEFALELVAFIKKLSFRELCMSIYSEFPEMAANSVFFGK